MKKWIKKKKNIKGNDKFIIKKDATCHKCPIPPSLIITEEGLE